MNYQQLKTNGYKYVWLQPKEGNVIGNLYKMTMITDKMLQGYKFSFEKNSKDIATFNQL